MRSTAAEGRGEVRSLDSQSSVDSASKQQLPASGLGKRFVVAYIVATTAVVVVCVDAQPLNDSFWPRIRLSGPQMNKRGVDVEQLNGVVVLYFFVVGAIYRTVGAVGSP